MRFRKKPVVIEAVQIHDLSTAKEEGCCACAEVAGIHIHTLEGPHLLTLGDWLITGIKGERYFCKPDIFAATYDAVEPAPAAPKAPERGACDMCGGAGRIWIGEYNVPCGNCVGTGREPNREAPERGGPLRL